MTKLNLTRPELASMIDQTLLRANACCEDFEKLCESSRFYGFKMVAVNPSAIELCVKLLQGSGVLVGAAIGFPLGQNTIETKVFETHDAIQKGAREIDYVINLTEFLSGNYDYIEREMDAIVSVCRKAQVTSKVIFENCYLSEDGIVKLCGIALKCGPDFIKTSTGFGPSSATISDVKLMKKSVGDRIKVKASGGIRSLGDAISMLEAGAERLGTSAGPQIMEEL